MRDNLTEGDLTFIKRIGDETWVYEYNDETAQQCSQWCIKNEPKSNKPKFPEGTEGHPTQPMLITSVWKIELSVSMLVLAQKEPILKAIIKICIKIDANVIFVSL